MFFILDFRDVDKVVVMTQKIYRERSDGVDAVHGEDEVKPGMSKTQTFKTPQNEDKIYELSHKKYAEQTNKKIKWAVNMYNE